jgi:hypothetical protein
MGGRIAIGRGSETRGGRIVLPLRVAREHRRTAASGRARLAGPAGPRGVAGPSGAGRPLGDRLSFAHVRRTGRHEAGARGGRAVLRGRAGNAGPRLLITEGPPTTARGLGGKLARAVAEQRHVAVARPRPRLAEVTLAACVAAARSTPARRPRRLLDVLAGVRGAARRRQAVVARRRTITDRRTLDAGAVDAARIAAAARALPHPLPRGAAGLRDATRAPLLERRALATVACGGVSAVDRTRVAADARIDDSPARARASRARASRARTSDTRTSVQRSGRTRGPTLALDRGVSASTAGASPGARAVNRSAPPGRRRLATLRCPAVGGKAILSVRARTTPERKGAEHPRGDPHADENTGSSPCPSAFLARSVEPHPRERENPLRAYIPLQRARRHENAHQAPSAPFTAPRN